MTAKTEWFRDTKRSRDDLEDKMMKTSLPKRARGEKYMVGRRIRICLRLIRLVTQTMRSIVGYNTQHQGVGARRQEDEAPLVQQ